MRPTLNRLLSHACAAALAMTFTTPAIGADGVLEINSACATQTGCFLGDAAGFPITITAPGSYRLTSNLTVSSENMDAIVVNTSDVSIDLGGFSIRGPVTCSGSPLTCTPSAGTGSGVRCPSSSYRGVSVRNGSITGMGRRGVSLGDEAEVMNLRVRWNGDAGIAVFSGSIVSGNTALQNEAYGIYAMGSGTVVSGNAAFMNGSSGIRVLSGVTVSNNSVFQNGGAGIQASLGSTIIGNAGYGNGGDGIECDSGCLVRANTMRANAAYGLDLGIDSAYSDNVLTSNTIGAVTGAGGTNSRGGNYCAGTGVGSASCP